MSDPMPRSLTCVLQAMAVELAELASLADHLEMGEGDLPARLDAAAIARFQLSDQLTQRLAGLTWFVGRLADNAPREALLDIAPALSGLQLAEQARRLRGEALWFGEAAREAGPDQGELMLFGD